jgi:hypothetical protein
MDDLEPDPWMLSRRDQDTLESLRDLIWSSRHQAECPLEMLAISGATHSLDCIRKREAPCSSVSIGWEHRVADEDGFGEGGSYDLSISDEGIILSKMTYLGGDHHSERVAELTPDGDFPHEAAKDWIAQQSRQGGTLTTSINFLALE